MPQTDQPSPSSPTHQSNPPPPNSRVLDPYVIHPSDNPATVLFSPLLQGDNYGAWIKGITKALNANGKLGFVDGSLPPSEDDLTHRCWKRYDDLVGSWLLNSVHPDIRASCLYAASSYAIRKDFQYDSLVASTEACICGAGKHMLERLERDRAMEFLQGLHDRFSNLRSQILTMEPFPTAFHIFNIVQQEEEQQNITASPVPTIESAALNTSKHFASSSRPPASQNKRQRPHCDYCNRHGHVRDKCYKMHGFPTTTNKFPVAAVSTSMPPDSTTIQPAIPALSADQYARLLALINPPNESAQIEHRANFAGPSHETSDWSG
ncbi:uncharacterized protein LOC113301602 isoform X2 [Papaver somniferum]|uniref:uncharacterized protein LOC113301602 isoform X2 n=1 Tax=Papaver somniferum TaxID=3469 RepID=UPI000E6FDFD4|nr:uncharacterized protein LOC113301602 isoform X2 [Papaver somniferum]